MKKMLVAMFVSSLCAGAFATNVRDSGPFNLTGGVVAPRQKLQLSLDPLLPENGTATYTVTCYVENTNFTKHYPVIMQVGASSNGSPTTYVNGHPAKFQEKFDQLINVVIFNGVNIMRTKSGNNTPDYISSGSLIFNNLDDSDSVFVQYCHAIYTT